MKIERGGIFFADLSPVLGSEVGGMRYVVVIQNNELNDEASSNGGTVIVAPLSSNGGTVIVAPLSSNSTEFESQNAMATIPVDIPELPLFSYRILLFGIRAIDTKRLKNHIGRLSDETMAELDKKLKYALGL